MRIEDLNELKGNVKTAMQTWSEDKIDNLLPGKPNTRVVIKNGINNLLQKHDADLNNMIDGGIMLVGKNGTVDTDTAMDLLVGIFKEMDVKNYSFGIIPVTVGKGEIVIGIPHNPILDMLVGDLGKVTITAEDLLELKDYF